MGAIVSGVAGDLASGLLQFYVRESMLSQTTQNKPLLKAMTSKAETFPGGLGQVSVPVQIAFMFDTAGFYSGYSEDDALTFAQATNMLRAAYSWKEHHSGLAITWSELKKDGISITQGNSQKNHSKQDLIRLTGVMKNRMDDFGESVSRAQEHLFWMDGTQDSKAMPGVSSLIYEDPTTGSVGGLSAVTYISWRNIYSLNIATSGENQTLIREISSKLIQIRRYGGNPDLILCGSSFRDALEVELRAKGLYTQSGFGGKMNIGMGDIVVEGVGIFRYEPWLDDHGQAKYCYVFDTSKLKLRPMEGELNKIVEPERPYNYMVFFRSLTTTSAMVCTQRNAQAIFSVA